LPKVFLDTVGVMIAAVGAALPYCKISGKSDFVIIRLMLLQ